MNIDFSTITKVAIRAYYRERCFICAWGYFPDDSVNFIPISFKEK